MFTKLFLAAMALSGVALVVYGARELIERLNIGAKALFQHGAAIVSLGVAIVLMMKGLPLWAILASVVSLVFFGWSIPDPIGQARFLLERLRGRAPADPGWPRSGARTPGRALVAAMSLDEARGILALGDSWDEDAVVAAHRRMLMRVHPDHGGSDYLAAKINEARDVLLSAARDETLPAGGAPLSGE
ncbi:MAG: hypothetical protein H6923_10585 [Alphaproteobacteria bacterium]|nr:hypothetical protein [Alphaproteobacteria bacterium]